MPDDIGDEYLRRLSATHAKTQADLLATEGTNPDHAAKAIRNEAPTGIPAGLGAGAPDVGNSIYASQNDGYILNNSPHVQSFVAGKPERLAAIRDDLGPMSKLGNLVDAYTNKFSEVKAALPPLLQEYQRQAAPSHISTPLDTSRILGPLFGLAAAVGQDIVPPVRLLNRGTTAASRAAAAGITDTIGFAYDPSGRRLNREESIAKLQDVFRQSLWYLAPGRRAVPGVEPPPVEIPAAPGPEGPTFTPEGVVASESGKPANFGSVRDAVMWLRANARETLSNYEVYTDQTTGHVGIRQAPIEAPAPSQEAAQASHDQMADLEKTVAETKTQSREPVVTEQFVDHLAPDQRVFVPAEDLAKIAAEGNEVPSLGVDAGELHSALVRGGDVEVSLGKYLAAVSGHPSADELRKAIRFSSDGVSVNDADLEPKQASEEADLTAPLENAAELQMTDGYKETYQLAAAISSSEEIQQAIQSLIQSGAEQNPALQTVLQGLKDALKEKQNTELEQANEDFSGFIEDVDDEYLNSLVKSDPDISDSPAAISALKSAQASARAAARSAAKMAHLEQVFKDPKALGLTKPQFALYSEKLKEFQSRVYQDTLKKVAARIKRSRTKEWRDAYQRHYPVVLDELMTDPAVHAYHTLKYGDTNPTELTKDNEFAPEGVPTTFYHGTNHLNIEVWKVPEYSSNKVISFAEDPNFSSRWAEGKGMNIYGYGDQIKLPIVYIVHLKAKSVADFRKPEDVEKAANWYAARGERGKKSYAHSLRHGDWGYWENPEMWADLGWDATRMVESPSQIENNLPNAAVANGNQVFFKYLVQPGELAIRLSPEGLSTYPKELVAGLPKGITDPAGVSPDLAAEQFGFSSGEELLRSLRDLELQRKAAKVSFNNWLFDQAKAEATARTADETGLKLDAESIMEAAREAVANPQAEDLLISELKAISKTFKLPFDEETVRAIADTEFAAMRVGEATNIRAHEVLGERLAEKAEYSLLKGDIVEGFEYRQKQLINHYILQSAHFLKRNVDISSRKYARISKKKTSAGINQAFLDQLHSILPDYGFPTGRDEYELAEALNGVTLAQFVADVKLGNPVFTSIPNAPRLPFKTLLVEDFWSTREFLNDMISYGREAQTLVTVGKAIAHEAAVAQAVKEAPLAGKLPPPTMGGRPPRKRDSIISKVKGFDAAHRKIARMVDELGGYSFESIWSKVMELPLDKDADKESLLRHTIMDSLEKAFNKIPRVRRRNYSQIIEDHPFYAPDGRKLQVILGDVPGMMLNVGSESSLNKLAEGFLSTPMDVLEFIDRHGTKEEADLAQLMWDHFKNISGDVSTDLRALKGVGLERVPARKWSTPWGEYAGGYFPLRRDRALSPVHADELSAEELLDPVARLFRDVAPDTTFAEKRTGAVYAVDVSLPHAYHAFDNHIRFVSYARTLASIRRFVHDPRIKDLVETRLGTEYYQQIDPYLNSVVADWTVGDAGMRELSKFADYTRKNLSVFALTGSIATTLSQAAGLPVIAAELAAGVPGRGVVYVGIGIKKFLTSTVTGNLEADIFSKSEFMKRRFGESNPITAEALASLRGFHTYGEFQAGYNALITAGYNIIGLGEFITASGPGWFGAYEKAIGLLGYDEAKAVAYADRVVKKSQGSGRRVDLAAVQRGNAFQRILYLFSTYFNASYQYGAEVYGRTKQGQYGAAFTAGLGVFLIAPLMGTLLSNNGPKDLNPVTVFEWALEQIFSNYLRPVFYAGSPASVLARNITPEKGKLTVPKRVQDWDFSSDPLTRQAESLIRGAALVLDRDKHGHPKDKRPVATAVRAVGAAVPLPFGAQIARTGETAYEVFKGKSHLKGLDLAHDLAYGPSFNSKSSGASGSRPASMQ